MAEEQIIGIGTIMGGPEDDSELAQAVDRAWRLLRPFQRQSKESVRVVVLFLVPGSVWQPDRAGVRLGRFLPEESLFEVGIALGAIGDRDPMQVVWQNLEVAVERVERALRKRGSHLTTDEARTALELVRNDSILAGGSDQPVDDDDGCSREFGLASGTITHVLIAPTAMHVQRFGERLARDGFIVVALDGAEESDDATWFGVVRMNADVSPGPDLDADFLSELAGLYDIAYDGLETSNQSEPRTRECVNTRIKCRM